MLKKIIKFFKALNSNSKPSELANALCLGIMLGFIPKNNALWFLIFIFFCFVRINKGLYFVAMIVASQFAWLLDSKFDSIGFYILNYAPLTKTFSMLIDIPFVGFTKFNNTIVCGSLVLGILCYIPLFFIMLGIIHLWRKFIAPKFNDSKLLKTIYKLPLLGKIASKI